MVLIKNILLWASKNDWTSQKLPKYKFIQKSLSRFMPGESLFEALDACNNLENTNYGTIITYLGENVTSENQSNSVTNHYLNALSEIKNKSLGTLISIKLTQLGLDFSKTTCITNMKKILDKANELNTIVWIDMEEYKYIDKTLDIYKYLSNYYSNIGITLQSYLYRTNDDLFKLLDFALYIRLVKGAYVESESVSIKDRDLVDNNYIDLSKIMLNKKNLSKGFKPSFATHDDLIIREIVNEANKNAIDNTLYEFNMLYGIRPKLQNEILKSNQNIKILISYGEEWFPWYMRRLAENPKNLFLLLK